MSKDDTAIVKGIAIICMLFHHLFGTAERYAIYGFTGLIRDESATIAIAKDCYICVALFALLSGYGMTAKFRKLNESDSVTRKTYSAVSLRSYCGLIKDTVFLLPIMIVITEVLGFSKTPESVWGEGTLRCIWGAVANMTGLANFFKMAWFVSSWWYLKLAILFIVLFPLFYAIMRKCGSVCFLASGIIAIPYMFQVNMSDTVIIWRFLPAFLFGMVMAENCMIEKIEAWGGVNRIKKLLSVFILCIILILFIYLKHLFGVPYITQSVQAAVITILAVLLFRRIPLFSIILRALGNNSKYMWLIHVYIYEQVMTDWWFSLRNIWLILACLLIVSFAASVVLRRLADAFYNVVNETVVLVCKWGGKFLEGEHFSSE